MITDDIELVARGGKSEIVQELEDELDIYEKIKAQSGRTEEEEKELYISNLQHLKFMNEF